MDIKCYIIQLAHLFDMNLVWKGIHIFDKEQRLEFLIHLKSMYKLIRGLRCTAFEKLCKHIPILCSRRN